MQLVYFCLFLYRYLQEGNWQNWQNSWQDLLAQQRDRIYPHAREEPFRPIVYVYFVILRPVVEGGVIYVRWMI